MDGKWSRLIERVRGVEYQLGLITPDTPRHRVEFTKGLTDAEVSETEERFGFRFPADLRDFLQTALPIGPQFPDWRSGDHAVLRDWLERPIESVLTDVRNELHYWLPDEWGERPSDSQEAVALVSRLLEKAPRLIPIYSHRMMPDAPSTAGNPVFSVYGTDIICYGIDLEAYLAAEFHLPGYERREEKERSIEFWSSLSS